MGLRASGSTEIDADSVIGSMVGEARTAAAVGTRPNNGHPLEPLLGAWELVGSTIARTRSAVRQLARNAWSSVADESHRRPAPREKKDPKRNGLASVASASPLCISLNSDFTSLVSFQIGSEFHIPHGIANAMLLCNTIRYNATNMPTKMTAFSQYDRPNSLRRYGEVAMFLGFDQVHTEDRVEAMLQWLEELKAVLDIPPSIQACGIEEDAFMAKVDELAVMAFDDQCTGANPRYPGV